MPQTSNLTHLKSSSVYINYNQLIASSQTRPLNSPMCCIATAKVYSSIFKYVLWHWTKRTLQPYIRWTELCKLLTSYDITHLRYVLIVLLQRVNTFTEMLNMISLQYILCILYLVANVLLWWWLRLLIDCECLENFNGA